jgi:hypothetical protein
MRTSYFRRMAGQSYRRARSVSKRHIDYEALIRRGHEFKAKATRAVVPLADMRAASVRQDEAERAVRYRDSRE